MQKETLKEAGYVNVSTKYGEHILQDKETGKLEVWFSNKNHASYGLIYKNTHLEFARTASLQDMSNHDLNEKGYKYV